jgi:hypothetical protein
MVFDKLANVVTKRYKLIIVIWAVLLLLSIPAMMGLDGVVSYDSEMTSENKNESTIAAEIIAENFQGSVANSTLIIVLQSDDMPTAEARDFVLELQNDLASADLAYMESIGSINAYSGTVAVHGHQRAGPPDVHGREQVNQAHFCSGASRLCTLRPGQVTFASDMNETNASAYAYSAPWPPLTWYASQMMPI